MHITIKRVGEKIKMEERMKTTVREERNLNCRRRKGKRMGQE